MLTPLIFWVPVTGMTAFAGPKVRLTKVNRDAVIASTSAIESIAGQRQPRRPRFGHRAMSHVAAHVVGEVAIVGIGGNRAAVFSHALYLGLFVRKKINPE